MPLTALRFPAQIRKWQGACEFRTMHLKPLHKCVRRRVSWKSLVQVCGMRCLIYWAQIKPRNSATRVRRRWYNTARLLVLQSYRIVIAQHARKSSRSARRLKCGQAYVSLVAQSCTFIYLFIWRWGYAYHFTSSVKINHTGANVCTCVCKGSLTR